MAQDAQEGRGTAARAPVFRVLGVAAAFTAGAVLAAQVRVNGALGAELGDAFATSAVSFATGLVVAAALVLSRPRSRRALGRLPSALRSGPLRWWHLLGGLSGVLYIFAQGFGGAAIGAAVFSIGVIVGQNLSSLAADRLGLGPLNPIPLTARRVVAAVLGIVAGIVVVAGNLDVMHDWLLIALPVAAGLSVGWQQAVNSRVSAATGDPFGITLINFAIGFVVFAPIVALSSVAAGAWPAWPSSPWLYTGGALGVLFVVVATVVVERAGVLVFALASIAGQLVASMVFDLVFPTTIPVGPAVVVGAALAFVAVVLVSVPTRARVRTS